ncbi:hypothetical protein DPMN_024878 [Dreissena polymorpha]|uniref:Uncharacterized protein n=1 Tax=Dreissena polymorpha TaxID=45954 RepID=A0A9D4LQD2_DREPO|nr:hypothetical protein DPMN_024878 [Dreissena polymorpha]
MTFSDKQYLNPCRTENFGQKSK